MHDAGLFLRRPNCALHVSRQAISRSRLGPCKLNVVTHHVLHMCRASEPKACIYPSPPLVCAMFTVRAQGRNHDVAMVCMIVCGVCGIFTTSLGLSCRWTRGRTTMRPRGVRSLSRSTQGCVCYNLKDEASSSRRRGRGCVCVCHDSKDNAREAGVTAGPSQNHACTQTHGGTGVLVRHPGGSTGDSDFFQVPQIRTCRQRGAWGAAAV